MWGLLDPHVQGPRVGVSTHNSYSLKLCSTPRALARLGGGISCHFLGQAGPCVLRLLAGHLSAGTGVPGGSSRQFVPVGL